MTKIKIYNTISISNFNIYIESLMNFAVHVLNFKNDFDIITLVGKVYIISLILKSTKACNKEVISMKRPVKNSKKGFTMVELIIVIAVLAILAAIAVPIIGTVIKSSQLSALESDSATVETMLSTALMEYEAGNTHATYNNAPPSANTKISDILIENNIGDLEFQRMIGGKMYYMTWTDHGLEITNSPTNAINNNMTLYDLKTA